MSKTAQYYEQAKQLYVEQGFKLDTIVAMLKDNVSRKTLFNWKTTHNWDELRKREAESQSIIRDDLKDIVRKAIAQYNADPTAHNMYALSKAIQCYRIMTVIKDPDDNQQPTDKTIKPDTIKQIERDILGLE